MPALAVITSPNACVRSQECKQEQAVPKKKVKPSSLCYTPPAMINDKKRDRSYFRQGLLGEGGFARCFEVTDYQGTRLAAKCIAKKSITSEKVKMKLLGEIKVHKSMDHPNIVRQRDCFEDPINVYMILDICTNGTLMDMLRTRKRFTEPEVRYYGLQILGAVKYMHSRRVIHRDLKLGNLMLDENMCIKVGDFGLAALLVDDNDRKKTLCGTPNYIAPEVLFPSPEGHSYEVDLWAIGVILYVLLIGKPPFQSEDVKAIYAKIKINDYEFPSHREISPSAKDLIKSLLSSDPETRPSLDDIANHEFFNDGIMPRSIPATATKQEPIWPKIQSVSMFKRNFNFVCTNAGIGQDQSAGNEPGQIVDHTIERPERGRYLPVSLSPRVGETPRMVNLLEERAGGQRDSLSARLRSVQLTDGAGNELEPVRRETVSLKNSDRDMRRATLATGALRAQAIDEPMRLRSSLSSTLNKPLPKLHSAERLDKATTATTAPPAVSRLGVASRVISETQPTIKRSSRLASIAAVEAEKTAVPGLSRPLRRTVSTRHVSQQDRPAVVDVATRSRASSRQSQATTESDAALSDNPITERTGRDGPLSKNVHSSRRRRYEPETLRPAFAPVSQQKDGEVMWAQVLDVAVWLSEMLATTSASGDASIEKRHDRVLHISKWVDYSHKYGLGYELSDESNGVFFNDATSVILARHAQTFEFISVSGVSQTYSIAEPPKELEKKVYLSKHFKGYMTTHLNNASTSMEAAPRPDQGACYMTHYWRAKEGILFRLSDGTLQLNFTDHSKLMVPMPNKGHEGHLQSVDVDKNENVWPMTRAILEPNCRQNVKRMIKILQEFVRAEGQSSAL